MKKIYSKIRWLPFLFVFLFLLPIKVYASVDSGVSCTSTEECVSQFREGAICRNSTCHFTPPMFSNPSSLQEFQETIQQARETGEMPRERWAGDPESSVVSDIINSLNTSILGEIDWESLNTEQGSIPKLQKGGALSFTANLISAMYSNPPASSREYLADIQKNLGVAKPAYAQGIGFSGLSNLLPLWKAARNIAYAVSVLIFIYIGMAIMFRVKLDPKTVITLQNSIPKIIVALIFVTFSYAIAGLMIDFIYLIIYVVILALEGPLKEVGLGVIEAQGKFSQISFPEAIGYLVSGTGRAVWEITGEWIGAGIIGLVVTAVTVFFGWITTGLLTLIFAGIILFLILKLFLKLLVVYINIIILIISAPIQIIMGVLPGNIGGFGNWFKNLLANILVFPAVTIVIVIGYLLTKLKFSGPSWQPPVLGLGGDALVAAIGLGILLTVSNVPDKVREIIIKAKPMGLGPVGWITGSIEQGAQKQFGSYVVGGGLRSDVEKGSDAAGSRIRSLRDRFRGTQQDRDQQTTV